MMGFELFLPLVLIGFTILIFVACWRFSGFRMLFDDSACALCLGPLRTVLWTAASITGLLYLPFALLALIFGDLSTPTLWELLVRFGGSFLACLAVGVVAALIRARRIFSPRSYRQGLRRQLRLDSQQRPAAPPSRPNREHFPQAADRR